ncbi:amidohydrolase family protein [Nocardia arthritidis]|uniref:Amidohydrolase family protein n=1 Tax=Nocardia arthritidis TaxID=228602 RepID=A0A6G9Y8F1_9NOCA|nr:amidohydrolase family protein [Nocardia arthritidis]QIS09336.1 amidohydrolase family protein [Nocardia arthritidis]
MNFPDIRIIDAHIHQWDPFTTPRDFSTLAKLFRLLPIPVEFATRLAPRRDREFAGDPTPFLHPYLPPDYRADAADVPVDTVTHVEVEWSGSDPLAKADETGWVARLPFDRDGPELGAIVAGADPAAPRFAELLDAHRAASPLVCGIRTMVAHHPDPGVRSFTKRESALTTREFLSGFGILAEYELSFEAWVYSHALPEVTALAQRYPEVSIVLDHLGTPAGIFGPVGKHTGTNPGLRRELFVRWRDDLAALAAQRNVVAKVSGLMMPILGHPVPPRGMPTPVSALLDRIGPLVEHALDVFGAERLLWGSNFPVDKPITSIGNSMRTIAAAITGHGGGPAELEQVFRRTAQRTYRIVSAA